jgi:pyruvate/2-oxoglutarate dehydrogenase complex dihydrolipoamide acyltransferase (E2) component
VLSTPATRAFAKSQGIDINLIGQGTGGNGRVTKDDVLKFIDA